MQQKLLYQSLKLPRSQLLLLLRRCIQQKQPKDNHEVEGVVIRDEITATPVDATTIKMIPVTTGVRTVIPTVMTDVIPEIPTVMTDAFLTADTINRHHLMVNQVGHVNLVGQGMNASNVDDMVTMLGSVVLHNIFVTCTKN
jgi:hypothetical protein